MPLLQHHAAVVLLLGLLLLLPGALSFILPSPQPTTPAALQFGSPPTKQGQQAGRSSIFSPPRMGFYDDQRRQQQEQEQQAQMEWAGEFNSLLGTRGEDVCVIGYEGFVRTGSKGAVSCYSDGDGAGPPPLLTYTTLEELLSDERMPPEVKEQMAERVMSYDPELEVAVMFAYKGQVGLNVIRPTFSPKMVFEASNRK